MISSIATRPLDVMPPTTYNEYQTSFQLECHVESAPQDVNLLAKPNPNLPNEYFGTRKPRGRARTLKQSWNENVLSFATKNKPPTSGKKNSTAGQPFGLLTSRTPSSLNIAKDVEPETDWGEGLSPRDNGIANALSFTPEPFHCASLHSPPQGLSDNSPAFTGSPLFDSLSSVEGAAATAPFFLPPNTSLPLSSGSDIVSGTISTLLQGSSLDAFPSPLSPLQDLDVNMGSLRQPIELIPPRSRAPRLSKVETIANVLDTLKKAKITPADFLLHILDESRFAS